LASSVHNILFWVKQLNSAVILCWGLMVYTLQDSVIPFLVILSQEAVKITFWSDSSHFLWCFLPQYRFLKSRCLFFLYISQAQTYHKTFLHHKQNKCQEHYELQQHSWIFLDCGWKLGILLTTSAMLTVTEWKMFCRRWTWLAVNNAWVFWLHQYRTSFSSYCEELMYKQSAVTRNCKVYCGQSTVSVDIPALRIA